MDDDGYNQIANAIVNSAQEGFMFQNGEALAKLFVFDPKMVSLISSKIHDVSDFEPYTVVISDAIFEQFTSTYLRYVRDSPSQSPEESHKLICRIAELFTAQLAISQGAWLLPVMRKLALALCRSAQITYTHTQDPVAFGQAASVLLRLLIDLLSDNSTPLESSKRMGSLFVAGLLLRISLRTTAAPGAYASKALEVKGLSNMPVFSLRDRVSYSYWLGRYYLTCYYVDAARVQLEFAFNGCPAWHYHNKRSILRYLFVANLIRGQIATVDLLDKYEMEPVYVQLCGYFKAGNLAAFQQTLIDHMDFFRGQGNFMILMERTEILIYRNALRRLYLVNRGTERGKTMPYRDALVTFRLASQNPYMDEAEMECILSSLISQKFVLGFLFHHQKVINLSKKLPPFPRISSVGLAKGK
ncbi:hypothetical protein GGI07_000899 [Coemansia sp. Benny D115]|nr:hypothetical protein GGI07_000899 [Coemansia sp. Benny D115]